MSEKINFTKVISCGLIAYFILTFIYRISSYIGSGSSKECGFAIAAVTISWLISLVPYVLVDKRKFNSFIAVFMIGSAMRILLMGIFIVAVLKNSNLIEHVLLIWTAIIYFMFLAVDTSLNMRYIKKHQWTKKDFFADKKNEININNSESPRGDSE
ncbi:MAG: hypothetical protein ACIAQZ_06810 [Sedimentisphaeraceae bacterium JB056]